MSNYVFWDRVAYEGVQDGGPLEGQGIGTFALEAAIKQLALRSYSASMGGLTQAEAEDNLGITGDALTQFNDLRDSILTIGPTGSSEANRIERTNRRLWVVEGMVSACLNATDPNIPNNRYYHNGEAVRDYVKGLITAQSVVGGSLVGHMANAD